MISVEGILSIDKNDLQEASKSINSDELPKLVEWLSEKDDAIRYKCLQLLQYRSQYKDDVYRFWDVFRNKFKSGNSYQRSIGIMLIADNVRWDSDGRFDDIVDDYLAILNDEKPITVRQCIQALHKIVPYKKHLIERIADSLMSVDISAVKETMRKLILSDILEVLDTIRKHKTSDDIERYILNALTGAILDKKAKKQFGYMLNDRK